MSIHIGTLYHWSPRRNRARILWEGLRRWPSGSEVPFHAPWICLGTTPSSAWGLLSIDPEQGEPFDLWQVQVAEGDTLWIRGDFAPYLREIRVGNAIPSERLWWIAERHG